MRVTSLSEVLTSLQSSCLKAYQASPHKCPTEITNPNVSCISLLHISFLFSIILMYQYLFSYVFRLIFYVLRDSSPTHTLYICLAIDPLSFFIKLFLEHSLFSMLFLFDFSISSDTSNLSGSSLISLLLCFWNCSSFCLSPCWLLLSPPPKIFYCFLCSAYC